MLSQTSENIRGNKFTICIFTHLSYCCCCASFNLLTEFSSRSFRGKMLREENATDESEKVFFLRRGNVESILRQWDKFGKRKQKEFRPLRDEKQMEIDENSVLPLTSHGSLAFWRCWCVFKTVSLRKWNSTFVSQEDKERCCVCACESAFYINRNVLPVTLVLVLQPVYFHFQFRRGLLNLSRDS